MKIRDFPLHTWGTYSYMYTLCHACYAEWLYCPALLIPSQMRRTAGPTGPPPAKTPGAPRVGATGVSGATVQIAAASAAVGEFCSAEARQKREPDCCPPVEPNHNRRIESETVRQEAGPPPEKEDFNIISKYPCKPWATPILPWLFSWGCLTIAGLSLFPVMLFIPLNRRAFDRLDHQDYYPEIRRKSLGITL